MDLLIFFPIESNGNEMNNREKEEEEEETDSNYIQGKAL
jgi:hypothetical protein